MLPETRLLKTLKTCSSNIQVLLIVGVYDPEPVSHQKIEHMTGMAKSTAGRNINLLSKYTVKVGNRRVQGHGVVNSRPDYEEPKKYVVELTTKGRNVLKKISKALLEDWYGSV